jgi:peptide/nickel transport system permease protein
MRHGRGRRLLAAAAWAAATLLAVSVVTFLATNLTGIDAAQAALGRLATPEQVAMFRQQQALDEPLLTRYLVWMSHALVGDLGISLQSKVPVRDLVLDRALRSMTLAGTAMLLATPIAFALGALAALRPGGRLDSLISAGTLLIIGLPEFVVGLAILYVFAVWLGIAPPNSSDVTSATWTRAMRGYLLPLLTLTLLLTPYILRMVRSTVREVIATPYIQAAIVRGVPTGRLLLRHVLPNAYGPVINVVALSLAEVLAGVVVVETVFGFPGLGQLTVFAVTTVDYAVIQACVLISAVGFVIINLLADLLIVQTNPRLRRSLRR